MEQLDAVNEMLLAIRQPPVASLEVAGNQDLAMAIQQLDSVNREVQSKGWLFNTEKDVTLQVDSATGRIPAPSSTIRIEIDPYTVTSVDPVLRGDYLYDRESRSYTFTAAVVASRVVRQLDWAELPETAQLYIAKRAARVFSGKLTGSPALLQAAGQEELEALAELQRQELGGTQANLIRTNSVQNALNWRHRL